MMDAKREMNIRDMRYMAKLKKVNELMTVRPILEDLVRAAYPNLADKCLCARCLSMQLKRRAGNAEC